MTKFTKHDTYSPAKGPEPADFLLPFGVKAALDELQGDGEVKTLSLAYVKELDVIQSRHR